MSSDEDEPYSRQKLLGLDIIRLNTPGVISDVLSHADVTRVTGAIEKTSDLPWLFRWFLPKTRFLWVSRYAWFLPFRTDDHPTYAPCRAYLDNRFAQTVDNSANVKRLAQLLTDKTHEASERELSDESIHAIWAYIVPPGHPPIPDEHLEAASKQIGSIPESFFPWRFLNNGGTVGIFEYVEDVLKKIGVTSPPQELPVDVGHVFFAMALNSPMILEEIRKNPDDELISILSRLGPVENAMRMVKRESSLGGLLPNDEPAVPKKTVILPELRLAAKETGDLSFVFQAGPGQRVCAAKDVLLKFYAEVQEEVRKIRAGQNSE